jgi:hypothetical protein
MMIESFILSGMILPNSRLDLFLVIVYIVLCKIVALIYLWGFSKPRCGALVFHYFLSRCTHLGGALLLVLKALCSVYFDSLANHIVVI